MDRKLLLEKLEQMKKECAKKEKKLQKARRAARVKAHVKKKIQELNSQSTELAPEIPAVSVPLDVNVHDPGNRHRVDALSSSSDKDTRCHVTLQCPTAKGFTDDGLDSGDKKTVSPRDGLERSGCVQKAHNTLSKSVETAQVSDKVKDISVGQGNASPPLTMDCECRERDKERQVTTASSPHHPAEPDIRPVSCEFDSLAVTPSFRSTPYSQDLPYQHPLPHSVHSEYSDTFTLNLHSHTETDQQGSHKDDVNLDVDTDSDNYTLNLGSSGSSEVEIKENLMPGKNNVLAITEDLDTDTCTLNLHSESSPLDAKDGLTDENEADCCASNTDSGKKMMQKRSYDGNEVDILTDQQDANSKSGKLLTEGKPSESVDEDIKIDTTDCHDGLDSAIAQTTAALSAMSSQNRCAETRSQLFSEYTELDAIPFSQFELSEDFLSESSQVTGDSRHLGRCKRRHSMALVQRRSPRLSALDFDACDKHKTCDSRGPAGAYISKTPTSSVVQDGWLRLVRRQRKSQKALLVSSLFQYLIDEARRDKSVVEFQLPAEIRSMVESNRTAETPPPDITPDYKGVIHRNNKDQILNIAQIGRETVARADNNVTAPPAVSESEIPPEQRSSTMMNIGLTDSDRVEVIPETELIPERESESGWYSECDTTVRENDTSQNSHTHKCSLTKEDSKEPQKKHSVSAKSPRTADEQARKPEHEKLLLSPLSTPQHTLSTGLTDSPCLFPTQTESSDQSQLIKVGVSPSTIHTRNVSGQIVEEFMLIHDEDETVAQETKEEGSKSRAVFTPSKNKTSKNASSSAASLKYSGSAESGCKEPVVTVLSGTSDDEQTPYILSVQTTVLTLWTCDDSLAWTAELHWYLPQESRAEGACSVPSEDGSLVVCVWGSAVDSDAPFMDIFVYHWATLHTQRFSLPRASPVVPHRLFCHGLSVVPSTVLAFAVDKTYTRGKTYMLDASQSCAAAEMDMEMVAARLVDLRLVDDLPDAAVGLTDDHKLLVWNVMRGVLLLTVSLPDSVSPMSRLFSSSFYRGFLLQHVQPADGSTGPSLMAVNPTTSKASIVRRFQTDREEYRHCKQVLVHGDILLALSQHGGLHIWDSCSSRSAPLVTMDTETSSMESVTVLNTDKTCWLITGHRAGCLHIYSLA